MKTIKTFPRKVTETPNTFITLPDGTKLAARMWMPVDADKKPVPVQLEHLPYRKRGCGLSRQGGVPWRRTATRP